MAGYDIFSQPQGPQIDISLFGDAAAQGTNIGHAQPSGITSAIKGVTEGIQTGQKIFEEYQQSQIRQSAIEAQPTIDAMRQQELKNQQQLNEIRQLELDTANKTRDLTTTNTIQKLELENQQLTKAKEIQDNKQTIEDLLASPDPAVRRQAITDPKLSATAYSDSKLAEQILGTLAAKGDLTDQEKENALNRIDFVKAREIEAQKELANERLQKKLAADGDKDQDNVLNSQLGWVMNHKDVGNYSKLIEKVWTRPTGSTGQWQVMKGEDKVNTADGMPLVINDSDNSSFSRQKQFYKGQGWKVQDGSLVEGDVPTDKPPQPNLPPSGASSSNPVVQKALDEFNAKKNIPVQGVNQGTIEERLAAKRAELKARQQGTTPEQVATAAPTETATEVPTGTPMLEGGTPVSTPVVPPTPQSVARQTTTPNATPSAYPTEQAQVQSQATATPDATPTLKATVPPSSTKTPVPEETKGGIKTPAPRTVVSSLLNFLGPAEAQAEEFTPTKAPPSANAALTNAIGEKFSLDPVVTSAVTKNVFDESVYHAINNEPLLSNSNALIKGLASVESKGRRKAKSATGVKGLLQVTQDAASDYGLNRDIPEQNVAAGALYLATQLITFNNNLRLALTAYNAGPGTVKDAVKRAGSTKWKDVLPELKKNLSAAKYKEVEQYADKVIGAASHFVERGKKADQDFILLLADNQLLRRG